MISLEYICLVFYVIILNLCGIQADSGGCNGTLTSGMRDEQFSASSIYNAEYNASHAKWGRAGWAASSHGEHYLQIDFDAIYEITALDFQRCNIGWYARSIRVLYSDDGYMWTAYNSLLSNEHLGETFDRTGAVTHVQFQPPIRSRYIALNPTLTSGYPSLQIELYGCRHSDAPSNVIVTRVESDIEVDTVWIPNQNPILIDSTIDVWSSASLTVQAGVTVIFTSVDAGLEVFGSLKAEGIAGLKATFSSNHPVTSSKSKWMGLILGSGGNITLSHALIRQATYGVRGTVDGLTISQSDIFSCTTGVALSAGTATTIEDDDISPTDLFMRNSRFMYNTNGLLLHGVNEYTNFYFGYSNFSRNSDTGIYLRNWDTVNANDIDSNIHVVGSHVSENTRYGIYYEGNYKSSLTVNGCTFDGNTQRAFHSYHWYPYAAAPRSISFSNSKFINNVQGSIYVYCYICDTIQWTFNNNQFRGSSRESLSIVHKPYTSGRLFALQITNNTFSDAPGNFFAMSLDVEQGEYDITNNDFVHVQGGILLNGEGHDGSIALSKNTFQHIYGPSKAAIEVINVLVNITSSRFENCASMRLVNLKTGIGHVIEDNVFFNNSVPDCFIEIGQGYDPGESIVANNNYWGSSDITLIKSMLCDTFLDSSKARIEMTSFYSDMEMHNLETFPDADDLQYTFRQDLGAFVIGGVVKTSMDTSVFSNYGIIVNRSLIIGEQAIISLDYIHLNFTENRGVIVYGDLQVGALDGRTTVFQAQDPAHKWSGFHMYSHELHITNALVRDAEVVLDIQPGSHIYLTNSAFNVHQLLKNELFEGDLTLKINNSSIRTQLDSIDLRMSQTQFLDFEIFNSVFYSAQQILDITSQNQNNLINVTLKISNSTFESRYNLLSIIGCSSHISLDINECRFETGRIALYLQMPSINAHIVSNEFVQTGRSVHATFCGPNLDTEHLPHGVEISSNKFTSTLTGEDIYFHQWHTSLPNHQFRIANNQFVDSTHINRQSIVMTLTGGRSQHSFDITANTFSNVRKAISFIGQHNEVTINENILQNCICNQRCIHISGSNWFIQSLNITNNTFVENQAPTGVIQIQESRSHTSIVNIERNVFENNTGSIVTIATPFVAMHENVFETSAADYTVRVQPGTIDYSNEIVNASLNYWGTTDVNRIAQQIYDTDYDDALMDVIFRPYLGSRDITDIQNEDAPFVSESGEIGGVVRGDVILSVDQSPYAVIANIEIGEQDSLVIEAGVTLRFIENSAILVHGVLNVLGTEDAVVRMIPDVPSKKWRGLDLRSDLNSSTIQYLHVNDTLEGVQLTGNYSAHHITSHYSSLYGISILINDEDAMLSELAASYNTYSGVLVDVASETATTHTVRVDACAVHDNTQHGFHIKANALVIISNCELHDNRLTALLAEQTNGGTVQLQHSVLWNNIGNALQVTSSDGISIDSTVIRDHNYGYYYYSSWRTRVLFDIQQNTLKDRFEVRLTNNEIVNNKADGLQIRLAWASRGPIYLHLENNTFSNNNRTLNLIDQSYTGYENMAYVTLANNTFANNTYTIGTLIELSAVNVGNLAISYNNFEANVAEYILVLSGRLQQRSIGGISLQGNTFSRNIATYSMIDMRHYHSLLLNRNTFEENTTPCSLTVPNFDSTYNVTATHNYWGASDVTDVVNTVCGFEQDMEKSVVYYIPYYTDPELRDLVNAAQDDFNVFGSLGGEITSDLSVSASEFGTPVIIKRAIFIKPNVTLTIEEGTEIVFESGRGIYVTGVLDARGGAPGIVMTHASADLRWYGIVISSTQKSMLHSVEVKNTEHGIRTYMHNVDIKHSLITNSSIHCLHIHSPDFTNAIYDFDGTRFNLCASSGVHISGDGDITVVNITVDETFVGLSRHSDRGSLILSSSSFSNTQSNAIDVLFGHATQPGDFTLEDCVIRDCERGVAFSSANYEADVIVRILNNRLTNINTDSLKVTVPTYQAQSYRTGYTRVVDIALNEFVNACGISLITYNQVNLSFHDNVLKHSTCAPSDQCYLYTSVDAYREIPGRFFDVSTNVFDNITTKCIVRLRSNNDNVRFDGTFFYNQLLANKATEGVVMIESRDFTLTQNLFDNPGSAFDAYVSKNGEHVVNASHNWWGSTNLNSAYNRIFDKRRQPAALSLGIEPILTDPTIDCSLVNNCSSRGECVSPNRCRCLSGWTGQSCNEYDCGGVNHCYGNGECTGPNMCHCDDGWSGPRCIIASCYNVANCSGHGFCVRPDECACAAKYMGDDCGSCVELHWGPQCRPCPDCQHGTCHLQTGVCECDGINWTGYLCDECSETYYGPDCLPLMMALNIIPNQGLDTGGSIVHVWGHNFPEPSNVQNALYKCRFGTEIVNGTWQAWNHVTCPAPQHEEGGVILEVSPDGVEYTNSELVYSFYATCPVDSCGREFEPPRGQCLFGGCSCNLPWIGTECTMELLAPVIHTPDNVAIAEGSSYRVQLNLTQGSNPIRWSLISKPAGMTIDERSGLVEWQHAFAISTFHTIRAKATNLIGQHEVMWTITTPLSYSVGVIGVEPDGVLHVPMNIRVIGEVVYQPSARPRVVPIDVKITSVVSSRVTTLSALSNPLLPTTFTATYYPRPDDVGDFTVDAFHPSSDSITGGALTWSVKGMRCEPSRVTLHEYIEFETSVYENIATLVNIGGHAIDTISATVDGLPNAYVKVHGTNTNEETFLQQLGPDDSIPFDLVVQDARPLSGTIYVIFTSLGGTSTRLPISIRLSIRTPLLVFNPSSLRENVVRGRQKIVTVRLTNEGEVPARNVRVDLPNDDRLSLVAFSVESDDSPTEDHVIQPGGAAIMTLAVTTETDAFLGEMTGRIALQTDTATFFVSYTFFITSLQTLNLTVRVEDEYTYFASGSPLVSGAEVRLVNPRRGYSQTLFTSNETGYVVFEDLNEDQYTLYAQADGHASYSAIIIASPAEDDINIFLQRVAVRYTWTVTPTVVQDVYIITLDSTFETFVPMPVVTVEPAKVNTIPYEEEREEIIEFTITNHGLIRADNLRFTLPANHPYLNFESTIDSIGSIDANTSLIVPVRATLKSRVKRNAAAAAVCGLALLYDYDCGGTQTRNLDVTLTREYPGRPPLPCGLGGGGVGRGGGYGGGGVAYGGGRGGASGSSVAYNPVTPLSCDCAKTLIKSCALAYHPIAGCAIAVTDLGTAGARSGGDAILATLNTVLGLADTAFACVFGVVCGWCGALYTTIRCVIDVAYNCDGGRRRRDVSSEVVDNMLRAAEPMNNFLEIMADILGDEAMYNLDAAWYPSFKTMVGDDSEMGSRLSRDEADTILSTLVDEASRVTLNKFIERWNNTASAWENGTLNELTDTSGVINLLRLTPRVEQYLIDVEVAEDQGFGSIFDEFDHATNAYNTAERQSQSGGGGSDDGVCAKVRVRIVQELVLTRDAFNARLEIENGENSALEDINVEIEIRETYGSAELVHARFSIGAPELQGLSGVDGTGELGQDLSGSAEWLIIPYSIAAPEEDTLYDVGGRLSYRVGGSEFSVPLLPDTITVKPNPSLVVHYFHEKYVQGDDALTPEIEPIVPFSLAVMVMNNGYGIAKQLKISSAQPEIIENEKGLLVTFQIIGAQLGNEPITPSMTVDFGDISSFETKTARWLLTSTLKGTFYNYSATFENINPLGDPQLSLLDDLGYHELIHLVRMYAGSDLDDGLDDFLVNDIVDNEGMPDRLYNSANASDVHDVITANLTHLNSSELPIGIVLITVTLKTFTNQWFYVRFENNITSPDPADDQHLLVALRSSINTLLIGKNAWQTTHMLDKFFIHMLDFIGDNSSDSIAKEITYYLIYWRENFPPHCPDAPYSATIPSTMSIGDVVLTMECEDVDGLTYTILDSVPFRTGDIIYYTGEIFVNNTLSVGEYIFDVEVNDYSAPASLPVIIQVRIMVTDDVITEPTAATMSVTSSIITTTSVTSSTSGTSITNITSSTDIVSSTDVTDITSPIDVTSATDVTLTMDVTPPTTFISSTDPDSSTPPVDSTNTVRSCTSILLIGVTGVLVYMKY